MQASLVGLADAARLGAGDKLHVDGVFDTIFVGSFPAVHPEMVLVVRIAFGASDGGREHRVRLRLLDEGGQLILEQTASARIGPIPYGDTPSTNLIYRLTGATFAGPGRYRFVVTSGRGRLQVPFRVVRRDA